MQKWPAPPASVRSCFPLSPLPPLPTDPPGPTQINQVVSHPNQPLTITAHDDRGIRFLDNRTGETPVVFFGVWEAWDKSRAHSDYQILVSTLGIFRLPAPSRSASQIRQVVVRDSQPLSILPPGKSVHSMVAHLDAVTCLAVDPNGVFLMSGSKLNTSCRSFLQRVGGKEVGLQPCQATLLLSVLELTASASLTLLGSPAWGSVFLCCRHVVMGSEFEYLIHLCFQTQTQQLSALE